jgi:DNA-binding XRE family transcriptional regulator
MRGKLRELRKKQGYTQEQFAKRINVSQSHYAHIEIEVRNPSLMVALNIKRILDYEHDDIFFATQRPVTGHIKSKKTLFGIIST